MDMIPDSQGELPESMPPPTNVVRPDFTHKRACSRLIVSAKR